MYIIASLLYSDFLCILNSGDTRVSAVAILSNFISIRGILKVKGRVWSLSVVDPVKEVASFFQLFGQDKTSVLINITLR